MGKSKTDLFTVSQNRVAALAKAIGHPARVAILSYLLQKQSCVCGDLVEVLPLSQSTVSQHLKELKAVGIIQGEIEGTKTCYCIDPEVWAEAKALMTNLFSPIKPCC